LIGSGVASVRRMFSEIIGQHMKLELHGVGGEGATGKPGPIDRPFAFLDELLARSPLVVKSDDVLGDARHVGHDEPDARTEFARMPLNLGNDTARLLPASSLIAESLL